MNAEIRQLAGVSGHADKNGLLRWLESMRQRPAQVFVNHGDDESCTEFARCLAQEHGYEAMAPFSGTVYDLAAGRFVTVTQGVPRARVAGVARDPRAVAAFSALQAAVKQLELLVQSAGGRPNKELKQMTRQAQKLLEQWREGRD